MRKEVYVLIVILILIALTAFQDVMELMMSQGIEEREQRREMIEDIIKDK